MLEVIKNSWLMATVAALVLAVDQATKYLVSTRMQLYEMWAPVPALAKYFTITYITNTGSAFGLFKEWGTLFMGLAIIVIVFIIFYQQQLQNGQWPMRIVLGLLLGGAAGNLVDRLRFGHVIDIFDFKVIWPWIFNIADSSLVVGVALLILLMAREPTPTPHPKSAPPTEPIENTD